MARPTLDTFTQDLGRALGPRLVSLLLYGSAARGSHVPNRSDLNTLLICDAADDELFARLDPVVRPWTRAGHPAPLILTETEWRASADAFPIEYEDMRQHHRVLAGRDPWPGITVQRDHVRRQLEHELMGKLVQLRRAYAALRSDPKRLAAVLAGSSAGFFTMLRATLRLAGKTPATAAGALVREAGALVGFAPEALSALVDYAAGAGGALRLKAADPLPMAYLGAVARTAEFVNRLRA